jgi:hypothetical protein
VHFLSNGNVGIGTSSPDYQLDIENSSHAVLRLHAGVNSSASLRLKNDAQDWDLNIQTTDTFAIYNQTSGTQPFSILPNGNVGIAVTSPSSKLTVYGGGSTTSTLELRGGAAGNDNATVSTQQSMTFQIASAGASGRAFVFNKGGLGYSQGTNLASINDSGTFTATGDVVAYSDERLKSDIKTLDGSKVYNMR